jgi:hypothetical protein
MDGRATFTMVTSRMIINIPVQSTISAIHLRSVVVIVGTVAVLSEVITIARKDRRDFRNSSVLRR